MLKKAYKGFGMKGIIAKLYAKYVEKVYADYGEMAERLKKFLPIDIDILDVASGPGYLSIELAKETGFNVTGLDISPTFVQIANNKAKESHVAVNFVIGNASEMPFAADQFDFVICSSAFNYFSEPLNAINEIYRVLKTEGYALIIDIRNDITNKDIDYFIQRMQLSKWSRLFVSLNFKWVLRERAYSIEQMEKFVKASRFKDYQISKGWIGFELWMHKQSQD